MSRGIFTSVFCRRFCKKKRKKALLFALGCSVLGSKVFIMFRHRYVRSGKRANAALILDEWRKSAALSRPHSGKIHPVGKRLLPVLFLLKASAALQLWGPAFSEYDCGSIFRKGNFQSLPCACDNTGLGLHVCTCVCVLCCCLGDFQRRLTPSRLATVCSRRFLHSHTCRLLQ